VKRSMTISIPRFGRALLALLMAAVLAAGLLALVGTKPAEAAFPGGNGKIVFFSDRITTDNPEGDNEVFTMNPDGTGISQLTKNSASDGWPAWSADGTQIAFVTDRDGGNFEVYKMAADGSNPVNLTKNPAVDGDAAWSPDGTRITFSTSRNDTTPDDGNINTDIYTMSSANGSGLVRLTKSAADDGGPAWSPDGTKITFFSDRSSVHSNYEIYVMKAKPEGRRNRPINLSRHSSAVDLSPNWSPDGKQITFMSNRGVGSDFEIVKMNADGTDQTQLTENELPDRFPAWSPDGTQIAFHSERNNNFDVYVMFANGMAPTPRTNDAGLDLQPDWQPLRN
jgi:Tol biopolymer transport system component